MRLLTDSYRDRVLIGEIYLPVDQLVSYYGQDLKGAQLPFNFQLISSAWSPEAIAQSVQEYEAALPPGAWPNWVLGNHDQARIASRIGAAQARVAAMLLLTLRGTPTMYYGDELGMVNAEILPEQVRDPAEKNEPGLGLGRDPERSPMPWDNSVFAGFSSVTPWLPLGPDHSTVNVADLSTQPASILNLYRALIRLRRSNEALVQGQLENVAARGHVLQYARRNNQEQFAIILNLGHDEEEAGVTSGLIALSTHMDREGELVREKVSLRPAEGVIVRFD
jgi:alpha-glucosidase